LLTVIEVVHRVYDARILSRSRHDWRLPTPYATAVGSPDRRSNTPATGSSGWRLKYRRLSGVKRDAPETPWWNFRYPYGFHVLKIWNRWGVNAPGRLILVSHKSNIVRALVWKF
jgi:hypothetical protein